MPTATGQTGATNLSVTGQTGAAPVAQDSVESQLQLLLDTCEEISLGCGSPCQADLQLAHSRLLGTALAALELANVRLGYVTLAANSHVQWSVPEGGHSQSKTCAETITTKCR